MKIANTPAKNNSSNTTTNFKAFYSPQQIRELERFILANKHLNPQVNGLEIMRMRESIDSFNAFYNGTKTINPINISNELYRKMRIPSDFKGDKILAGACALTANIFHKLNLPQPKGIYKEPLEKGVLGNCNGMNRIVKFTTDFDWSMAQLEAIQARITNFSSSGHFLKNFLHEFFHNVQIKQLHELSQLRASSSLINSKVFEILGYNPDLKTRSLWQNGLEIKNLQAKSYIKEKLSIYGSTLPAEAYTETTTKMVTDTLDKRTLRPTHNPFVFKDFTQDKKLMEMMEDFYNGRFEKYI